MFRWAAVLRRYRSGRGFAVVVAVLATLLFAAPAMAATRSVDDNALADVGDCTLTPCKTIGYALTQAADVDVIQVAAGSYPEHVVVDKRLHLVGAKAGIDATTRDPSLTSGES